ncbi:MAG: hypothetical protein WD825_08120 [Gemmatimonadaceae bacterium]
MTRYRRYCLLRVFIFALFAAMAPNATAAQVMRFVTVGGGSTFPVGMAGQGINTGWLAEIMGGVTLPGNTVSLRLGGSYGQNRIDALSGGNMMGTVEGGIDRTLGAMAGIMVMPDLDRDLTPYVLASAGVMNSTFRGSTTSFGWATGVGATLQTGLAAFYVECRFVRARKDGRNADMIPLTAGIRLGN